MITAINIYHTEYWVTKQQRTVLTFRTATLRDILFTLKALLRSLEFSMLLVRESFVTLSKIKEKKDLLSTYLKLQCMYEYWYMKSSFNYRVKGLKRISIKSFKSF